MGKTMPQNGKLKETYKQLAENGERKRKNSVDVNLQGCGVLQGAHFGGARRANVRAKDMSGRAAAFHFAGVAVLVNTCVVYVHSSAHTCEQEKTNILACNVSSQANRTNATVTAC